MSGGPVLEWRQEEATMETYLMVLILIVATGGVILLFAGIGLLAWGLWRHWFVEPARKAAQSRAASEGQTEVAQP